LSFCPCGGHAGFTSLETLTVALDLMRGFVTRFCDRAETAAPQFTAWEVLMRQLGRITQTPTTSRRRRVRLCKGQDDLSGLEHSKAKAGLQSTLRAWLCLKKPSPRSAANRRAVCTVKRYFSEIGVFENL